jgi:hypothetical protein
MSFPGEGPHAVGIDRNSNRRQPPTAWQLRFDSGSEADV